MKIIIIGGAGFIGINAAYYFIEQGHEIVIMDNLSRKGSDYNLNNFLKKYKISNYKVDIRDFNKLKDAIGKESDCDAILLLAGQVAVTTSVINPREDFEINALGTFNVLEAVRILNIKPVILYSSTNKVYGKMEDVEITLKKNRYEYSNKTSGISEDQLLDFYSPYGCSKGAGEQYIHDYSRIYEIPTIVFRQSCIYGPNQFGIEDQGWVAWFTIATLLNKQISIYGDGNQIRDILFVNDLVKLYELAIYNKEKCFGKIYNVGGGPEYTLSLNELITILSNRFKKEINIKMDYWRPGDQKVYVSNISKVSNDIDWKPSTNINDGINTMAEWIEQNREILNTYVFGK